MVVKGPCSFCWLRGPFGGHTGKKVLRIDYIRAERNRGNVKGIAFMEALMMPVLPAKDYASMGKMLEGFFLTMRSQKGTDLMVKQNYFLEGVLPSMINRNITQAEMAVYRAPFPDEHSRRVIPPWPNMIPIGGEPAHTTAVVNRYNAWLKQTDMPMIVTYVSPGALIPPDTAQWLTTQIENLETAYVGQRVPLYAGGQSPCHRAGHRRLASPPFRQVGSEEPGAGGAVPPSYPPRGGRRPGGAPSIPH